MIAPGQSETVVWEVETKKRLEGKFVQKFVVNTNDRASAQVTLEGSAAVKTAMRTDPQRVSFGQVKRLSGEQRQTIRILRGDGGPITPEVVSTGNPQIDTELREITAGESYELDVIIRPPWPNAPMRGTVVLATGIEEIGRQEVMVYVPIEQRVRANPPRLSIKPADEEGQAQDMVLRFTWSDEEPAGKITEATVNNSDLSVSVEEQAGAEVVVLHVPAGFEMRRGERCNVTIRTDDPGVPMLRVPVWAGSGRGRPVGRPGLKTTPSAAGSAAGAGHGTGTRPK